MAPTRPKLNSRRPPCRPPKATKNMRKHYDYSSVAKWPKMALGWHKTAPRRPQDGPKKDQDGPKMAPRWPRMAQRSPNRAPRSPKRAPRSPKIAPRWPKMAPRCPKEAPRWPQDGPEREYGSNAGPKSPNKYWGAAAWYVAQPDDKGSLAFRNMGPSTASCI